MKHSFNTLYSSMLLLGCGLASFQSHSGAFSLYTEGSASAVGNFAAGVAAEGRDASIGWFNPAGLVLLRKPEIVLGAVGVLPHVSLTGEAIFNQIEIDSNELLPPYVENFNNLNGAQNAVVPNLHVAIPVGDNFTYGLSIVSPLGLSTSWPQDSALRYAATLSELTVVDISPEMGGLITNNLSVGWGLDIQWADVSFNNMLGSPAGFQQVNSLNSEPSSQIRVTELDSSLVNSGTSTALGFHAGFLLMTDDRRSRLGFNFQYGTTHEFNGSSALTGRIADYENGATQIDAQYKTLALSSKPIQFPNVLTFSVYQQVAPKVSMLGSIVYSTWSSFQAITLSGVAAYSATEDALYQASANSLQNYHNTIRASYGMNFDVTDSLQLRWGGGYDQSPTNDIDRDVRMPDVDKLAIACGLQWKMTPHWFMDVGYSYLIPLGNVVINKTQVFDQYNFIQVNATGHAYAQLIGAQIAWRN